MLLTNPFKTSSLALTPNENRGNCKLSKLIMSGQSIEAVVLSTSYATPVKVDWMLFARSRFLSFVADMI